jgi:hypothetical protein
VLKVTGEDAFLFLQGQFTQDVRPARQKAQIAYGLWLNQKGKILADGFVLRRDYDWLIISFFSSGETMRERLESYVIADDVVVEDLTSQWAGLSLLGAGVADLLTDDMRRLPEADFWAEHNGGVIFPGRRATVPSWEWLYPIKADDPAPGLRARGMEALDFAAMERLRIEAGIPSVPRDLGPDDLPNEGGLEHDAISYTKGCYLGQEVMARLRTMGRVRRRLLRVAGSAKAPEQLPAPLFAEGKKIGELRSAARTATGFIGLAMISMLGVSGKRMLSFLPDSPADVVITDAPA